MKVACYARVSDEKQVEKDLSIPAQLKALKKYVSHCQTNLAALIPYDEIIQEFKAKQ